MFSERLSLLPEELPSFRPCPPASDRAGWEGLPPSARQRLLAAGEAEAAKPIAPLPLHLWLAFTREGSRAEWEAALFSRRARLCALAAAECVEYKGRFLDGIADTLWAICEESAWQLPAHNSYVRDTPQLPLPDTARPLIDLFAAEAGALLSTVCYLLGPALEGAYPGLTRPVLFSYRFYNQDLTTGSLLLEVGTHGNNLNEALYAGQLAARALADLLRGSAGG